MKKIITTCISIILCFGTFTKTYSQNKDYGFFNSLAIGVNAGTAGIGFDVATPIGNYLQLRVGMNMMPDLSYDDELDINIYSPASTTDFNTSLSCVLGGSLKRSTTDIILNVYPFKSTPFFIAAGISFGGKELIKMHGHSDEAAKLIAMGSDLNIEIGDYNIPFTKDGDVAGGLKVKSTRPYIGLGFGRAVPKKRVSVMCEIGAQFHGSPKLYTNYGSIEEITKKADNKYTDIINDIKIYPVVRFRLCGRII